jgi:pimeloyl-ACP methyl ester carboxylesterase
VRVARDRRRREAGYRQRTRGGRVHHDARLHAFDGGPYGIASCDDWRAGRLQGRGEGVYAGVSQREGVVRGQAGADTEEGRTGRHRLAEKVAVAGSKVVAEAMIPKLFAATLPAGAPIVEQVRQIILSTQPAGIIGTLKGMALRPDSGTLLPNLRIPVLLLTGDKDQIIPPEKAKAMAAAIGTATLTTVDIAGHMPMLEQPQATTAAISTFLSEIGL